jgi:hypothetical protein
LRTSNDSGFSENDAEALIKQSATGPETIGTIGTSATVGTGFVHIAMELWHCHSGLKVSVVYRVPDGLNDLNHLNCLNEQRSLPNGLGERGSRRDPGKDRDEPKIRKWFQDLTRLST